MEKAKIIYHREKSKGLTDMEISKKFFILYHVAVKMGDPYRGTSSDLTIKQAFALYSIQPILFKVYRIASEASK